MSETSSPRRELHLVLEGFPVARKEELAGLASKPGVVVEIFTLTESTAHEALERIFAADTVAVWGEV